MDPGSRLRPVAGPWALSVLQTHWSVRDLETWFPLAVGSTDLDPSALITAGMLSDLEPWIDAAAAQRRLGFAWTGDVNECSGTHRREAFAWLRGEVERETALFALALGCDLTRLQLHFRSSWPVLSQADETVSSHTHHGANLSAVYYISVPEGPGGTLVFENVGAPNSLGPEFGEPGTALTGEANPLNLREACYPPRAGRLLLFPARQPHAVRAHGADALRVSITFDIALVDRDAKPHPADEPIDALDLFR